MGFGPIIHCRHCACVHTRACVCMCVLFGWKWCQEWLLVDSYQNQVPLCSLVQALPKLQEAVGSWHFPSSIWQPHVSEMKTENLKEELTERWGGHFGCLHEGTRISHHGEWLKVERQSNWSSNRQVIRASENRDLVLGLFHPFSFL